MYATDYPDDINTSNKVKIQPKKVNTNATRGNDNQSETPFSKRYTEATTDNQIESETTNILPR